MGGALENFILDRNFQSRSKSRIFLIFGGSRDSPPRKGEKTVPKCLVCIFRKTLGVATPPAEPRGEKNTFFLFVQILGGEKLLKFVEKCR